MSEVAYSNSKYLVQLATDPYILEGEAMQWEVVNIKYGTVEATVSVLPNAIAIANSFTGLLEELIPETTATVRSIN